MHHLGPISAVAAHGPYVATAGYDNQLILWDRASGQARARGLHDHLVNHCAFSSDGALLASASSDYSARIWDVETMRLRAALVGHEDDVDMAVFSPDDKLIATCALDRTLKIFDLAGRCLKTFRGHAGNILTVAWSHCGGRLVSSSVDGTVREWDVATGSLIRSNNMDGVRTDTLEIDRMGRIYAGDDEGRIIVIHEGEQTVTQAHKAGIKKLALVEETGTLITLSYDRKIAIWSVGAGGHAKSIAQADIPAIVWARSAAIAGPTHVAVGTFGSTYGLFDWSTGEWSLDAVTPDLSLNAVTISGDSAYSIGDAGILFRDGEPISRLGSLCNFILPVGGRLLTGGQMGELFDARTGAVLYRHHSPLNCGAAFLRNAVPHAVIGAYTGELLTFAAPAEGEAHLVDITRPYENAVKGVAVRGDEIFSVCASTHIAWHDARDMRLVKMLRNAHERIANACSIAGQSAFASVGRDRKLRIWKHGEQEVYDTPHPNSVKCVCASDDGETLMTGAYTGTVAAFDMRSRRWTLFRRITASGISSLAFDPKTRAFLASSYDGQIYRIKAP